MIRAAGRMLGGGTMVMLGLSYTNVMRLLDGEAMQIRTAELNVHPPFEIWMLGAETLAGLEADLALVDCLPPPELRRDDGSGVLAFTAAAHRGPADPPGLRVPGGVRVFVIGLTRRACLRLIDDGDIDMRVAGFGPPGGPDPHVLLVAGRTEDAIAARMRAHGWLKPSTEIVDRRNDRSAAPQPRPGGR